MLHITKGDEDDFAGWIKRRAAKAAIRLEAIGLTPVDFLSTELGWLLCLPKYEDQFLEFDHYQLRLLMIKNRRRIQLKARQIGFSFMIACESVARCHLKDKHTAICISYNMDDAKEKIARVKELHEDLPLRFQKKIVIDSKKEVAFQSNGSKRRLSRVVSYPSRAPRGKTGDVYLDELAHCPNDKSIYSGATAVISRSGGQLTIGSTPLGRRGQFHAIFSEEYEKYPGFWRQEVPWWLCRHFCHNIPGAVANASTMTTEQRVHMFGTAALIEQFNALTTDDFQQEFEMFFQDERVSFYPYELILPCAKKEKEDIPVYKSVSGLFADARRMGPLKLGFDVGRTKHPSELYVFEKTKTGKYLERYNESFKDVPFPDQRERLRKIGRKLADYMEVFRIDQTGLGRNLAEDLQRDRVFGKKVRGVQFTNSEKEKLASSFKILLEEKGLVIAKCRDTISQIHSIKQKITASGNYVFDSDKNSKHHADKFWAMAMATYEERQRNKKVVPSIGVRVIGANGVESAEEKKPEPSKVEPFHEAVKLVSKFKKAVITKIPIAALQKQKRDLEIAIQAWKRCRDDDKVEELQLQLKAIKDLIRKSQPTRKKIKKKS